MPVGAGLKQEGDIQPLWQIERAAIEKAILLCEGNIPKAAAMLEISPSTIYRKKMVWDSGGTMTEAAGAEPASSHSV
jgi:two-component system repressor protein LuxO